MRYRILSELARRRRPVEDQCSPLHTTWPKQKHNKPAISFLAPSKFLEVLLRPACGRVHPEQPVKLRSSQQNAPVVFRAALMLSLTTLCTTLPHARTATSLRPSRPCCSCRSSGPHQNTRLLISKLGVSSPQLRPTSLKASEQEQAEEAKARNPLKPEQPKEEQSLGLVGTIITWGFLAVCFGRSAFKSCLCPKFNSVCKTDVCPVLPCSFCLQDLFSSQQPGLSCQTCSPWIPIAQP